MKHDADADAEVVLHRIVETCRVIVELKSADAESSAGANIDSAADCCAESRLRLAEIVTVYRRLIAERACKKVFVNLHFVSRNAN